MSAADNGNGGARPPVKPQFTFEQTVAIANGMGRIGSALVQFMLCCPRAQIICAGAAPDQVDAINAELAAAAAELREALGAPRSSLYLPQRKLI